MENKINIAELLKDCPKGMELDCRLYYNIYFDTVEHNSIKCYSQNKGYRTSITFNIYGGLIDSIPTKCVIFPKGKTTWEGFQRPFKDGDILATDLGSVFFLNTRLNTDECYGCYVGIGGDGSFHICEPFAYKECCGLATEEEKTKLFDAIKSNGYKWNPETKTLEKLPKFKVDNKIKLKGGDEIGYVTQVTDCYFTIKCKNNTHCWPIERQDAWELVTEKFDITTLKPFESKVLVRDRNTDKWIGAFYSHCKSNGKKFYTIGSSYYYQCIPYEGNEHLLDTTDDCDEYFKTWG